MRILKTRRGYFRGTHKGYTIEIERDRTSADPDCKFYITVQDARGCYAYDGWSPAGVDTIAQAKREALKGACL